MTEREKRHSEAFKEYVKGEMSINAISRKYHVDHNTLMRILMRNGIKKRERKPTLREKVVECLNKYGMPMSSRQISQALRIDPNVLVNHILYFNIKRVRCPCGQGFLYSTK